MFFHGHEPVGWTPLPQRQRDERSQFRDDVLNGLLAPQKYLLPKYFYDREGSALYQKITELPEYYPTRTELQILRSTGADMWRLLPHRACLIEFGSGSSEKAAAILGACPDMLCYVPIDSSAEMLEIGRRGLARKFPNIDVVPIKADFTRTVKLPTPIRSCHAVGFFPGSTIGNFSPPEATALLGTLARTLGAKSHLILGADLVKDRATLEAAYNDRAGITAAFNKNIIARIRRELDADIDPNKFRHEAVFNAAQSRIEMRLRSLVDQTVWIAGRSIRFLADEPIHTENSYKFTIESLAEMARRSGWSSVAVSIDPQRLFSVHLFRRLP